MLYTSYFANKAMLHIDDCVYISVACGNPKYPVPYDIVDCKTLKPYGLLGKNLTNAQFFAEYEKKLERIGANEILSEIMRLSTGHQNAVLLCHEKNGRDCHRRTFAEWFTKKTGIDVVEVGVPQRVQIVEEEEKVEEVKKDLEQISIFDIV